MRNKPHKRKKRPPIDPEEYFYMLDSLKYVKRIMPQLRRIWRFSPMRLAAKKRAKNKCEGCHGRHKKLYVDHIIPVAVNNDARGRVDRLFISSIGLQCLCHKCHTMKTKKERDDRARTVRENKERVELSAQCSKDLAKTQSGQGQTTHLPSQGS